MDVKKLRRGWIPRDRILPLCLLVVFQQAIYWGTELVTANAVHVDLTTPLDRMIPFLPGWAFPYLLCYGYWAVNYCLIAREGRDYFYRFYTGEVLAKCICGILFLLLPTTNVRPVITGNSLPERLMAWIFTHDRPENLFPSIHCLVSWFCFVGIRPSKKIPKWYKAVSLVISLLVFLSTQFTKQHYVSDAVASLALAECCYLVGMRTELYRFFLRLFGQGRRRALLLNMRSRVDKEKQHKTA